MKRFARSAALVFLFSSYFLAVIPVYGQQARAKKRISFPGKQMDAAMAGQRARPIKLKTKKSDKADLACGLSYCDLVDVKLKDGKNYTRILLPEVEMKNAVGAPEQPMREELVRIPSGAQVDLVIDDVSWYEVEGEVELPPVQPLLPDARGPNGELPESMIEFAKNDVAYSTDAYNNDQPVSLGGKIRIRGREYVKVIFQPVSYNPVQKKLRVAYDVQWHLDILPPPVPERRRPDKLGSPTTDAIDVRTEEQVEAEAPAETSMMDAEPQPDLVSSQNDADYLIITPDAFADEVAPLAAWKHQKGYRTYVATLSEVGGSTEADIKTYIQNAYDNGTATSYVLLIGDHEDIPGCEINQHPDCSGANMPFYSDLPYACVDGGDYYPDIVVGRLPGDSEAEVTTMVTKALSYDRTPDAANRYDHVLVAGMFQDDHGTTAYEADRWFMEDLHRVADFLGPDYDFFASEVSKGYTVHTALQWVTDYGATNTVFDPMTQTLHYRAGGYTGRETPPDPVPDIWKNEGNGGGTEIDTAINAGVGMVFHRDHGYASLSGASYDGLGWGDPDYQTSDVAALSNSTKLPFVFSLNCGTGHWEDRDAFAETWMTNSNGGAVGFTGAARISYSGPNDTFLVGLMDSMWDDYSTSPNGYGAVAPYPLSQRPAVALLRAKAYVMSTWGSADGNYGTLTARLFSWFGDPELELRTETPLVLAATHPGSLVVGATANFDVTVTRDGNNCEGALVCLLKDSDVYETAMTNASGVASFSFMASGTGTITVTASEQNSTPYEGTISVEAGDDPFINLSTATLAQTCPAGYDAQSQSFTISNPGTDVLNYTISDDASWLSCDPASGSADGETDTINVNYDTDALGTGNYTATITIADPNASNNPQTIAVSLDVENPTLVLYSPNGGEVMVAGYWADVEWTSTGENGNVKIELYKGGTLSATIAADTEDDGEYDWLIPPGQAAGTDYKVKITRLSAPIISDESDTNFEIEAAPTAVSLPYSESFEAGIGDWEQLADDDFDWTRLSGATGSPSTGPSTAQDGSFYLYTEASDPNNPLKAADLECVFDLRGTTAPQMTFWYHMYGQANFGMGTLEVEVSDDDENYDLVWSRTGDQGDQWYQATVDLSEYAGSYVNIAFCATTGGSWDSDMAIDNIQIMDAGPVGQLTIADTGVVEGDAGMVMASFTVTLTGADTWPVTVDYETEDGTATTADSDYIAKSGTLTFAANGSQTIDVMVNGDYVDEENEVFVVNLSNATNASIVESQGECTINDDDTAGVTVSPTSGLVTSEAGAGDGFGVVLNSKPTADVTIAISSSDESEGTVAPDSLTFTAANWDSTQNVTVTGVDDFVDDGDVGYNVVLATCVSADGKYSVINPDDVSVTNTDDDEAGFIVTQMSDPTSEDGTTESFRVYLCSQPTADVTVSVESGDLTEGTVDKSSITFTPEAWDSPGQTVYVTGVDDDIHDGSVTYDIILGVSVSDDPNYNGIDVPNASVINHDNDVPGITVSAISGDTGEDGTTASFTMVLDCQPMNDVNIALSSDNTDEGTVSPASLTFTPANWSTPQTVTVTGVDDDINDGDIPYLIITNPATSADADFDGIDPDDVAVVNVDDDEPGITVSAISGNTGEDGTEATFSVVLDCEPKADVTVSASSNNTDEGTVSPDSVTFTAANWDTPREFTVSGVDDDVDDGDVAYAITVSADSADDDFKNLPPQTVNLSNVDNDTAGVTVDPISGLTTTEGGDGAIFTVKLDSEPLANVTIALSSSDETEGAVDPGITFTPANWSNPQTVIINGVDDDIDDGDIEFSIITGAAQSTDPTYNNMTVADVSCTNIDDDTAGVTVTPTIGLVTTEEAGTDTFTVELDSEPTADVTIAISSSDESEGTVAPDSLTFTAANWDSPQTVTVTGVDDFIDDGDVGYNVVLATCVSADGKYSVINPDDVSVTNTDDDEAGFLVTQMSDPTSEDGTTESFRVYLFSQPTADVTVSVESGDLTEGTVDKSSITFTPEAWDSPGQTVYVTGVDDDIHDGSITYDIILGVSVSDDPNYNGIDVPNASVINHDNDVPGITVSAISGDTGEDGTTASFTMVLDCQPMNDVNIALSSDNTDEGTVSPASLTFTPENWNTPQTATVTGVDDDVDDGDIPYLIITNPATSADADFDGIDPDDVAVINVDDDTAGVTVSAISGNTGEDGTTATFTVVLDSEPTDEVLVPYASSDPTEGSVEGSPLTFTAGNWDTPQTVTVTGVDDFDNDGDVAYTINLSATSSPDPKYDAIDPADVSVTNIDNDEPGVLVSAISGNTTEAAGTATFTVSLTCAPTDDVFITYNSSNTNEGTVDGSGTMTFTNASWSQVQTYTVTGVDDDVDDGDVAYSIILNASTSDDPDFNGINPDDVAVINVDDDTAGVTLTPTSGPNTSEAGGTTSFTLELDTKPLADVTIGLSSSDESEGTVAPVSVTFTYANWNTPQEIIVTGVDDDVNDGDVEFDIITGAAQSDDPKYQGMVVADIAYTNTDDDVPGITVNPTDGLVTDESGATAQFTVVLDCQPQADVSIGISSSDEGEGTVDKSSLTFTDGDWDTPQTVTITGQDDALVDGAVPYTIVTAAATSTDPDFNGINPADVNVINNDNEVPGVTISKTSGLVTTEAGGTDSFTVRLNTQPTDDVPIPIDTSDASEGTADPAMLIFTNANWNVPQTVTVTGVDDSIDDGGVAYTIVTGAINSADNDYNGLNPVDVSATNINDDTAGVTVSAISGNTGEDGTTATFTVVLDSEPTDEVPVPYASSDTSEGTVSGPGNLIFNAGNWDTPQTVTVTGVDDVIVDGDVEFSIIIGAINSPDSKYNGINPANVSVTNLDDDVATLSINDVAVGEGNAGTAVAQFTVTMSCESTSTVSVDYATSDNDAEDENGDGDYQSKSGTLTFNPGDLTKTIDITVNGDTLDEDDETFTVTLSNASGAAIADATGVGTITDDDALPNLVIDSITVAEGDSGTTDAVFTVTLIPVSGRVVTVDYETMDNTAEDETGDGDYQSASGTLTFNPGETTQTFTVQVNGDTRDEDDELFHGVLAPATVVNAHVAIALGDATIIDDDTATLSIDDVTVVESDAGTTADFTVTLSCESSKTVTVDWATADNTAEDENGDGDYQSVAATTLTFNPGDTSKTCSVTINGDNVDEDDETFFVNLTNETNAAVTDAQGVGTIIDDDHTPVVADYTFGIDEAATNGTLVGEVVATDGDDATLSYLIIGGNVGGAFAIADVNSGAVTVADESQIDFDVNPVYTLTVQVSDGTNSANSTVTISVGECMAYGIIFTVKASDVDSPLGGKMTKFVKRPKIIAHYTDPVRGRVTKTNVKILTRVPARDGSDVTEVDCEWTRTIPLYDKKALKTANKAGTYTSTWLGNNPIADLECTVQVITNLEDRTVVDDQLDKPLLVTSPQITDVQKWDGTALGDVQTSSIVVLRGKYFGSKPPSVWLEYLDARGRIKSQRLKVQRIYEYDDSRGRAGGSCMDLDSGTSGIRVEMPRRWWKDWTAGTYDLVIDNRIGMDSTTVDTVTDAANTVPTLAADAFNLTAGERSYQLDVLANDSDTHSDNVSIEFVDKSTDLGGKVKYDKKTGKVCYTPPRDAVAPFTDTFEYTLDDGHSDEADWPAAATVIIDVDP